MQNILKYFRTFAFSYEALLICMLCTNNHLNSTSMYHSSIKKNLRNPQYFHIFC